MLSFLNNFNQFIFVLITAMYCYQLVYVLVALVGRSKESKVQPSKLHKFAVIIAARNERAVIGELIKSIRQQKYPRELIDIFVVADNCTDDTAEVSRRAGAYVYERFNKQYVGKGYALDYIFNIIHNHHRDAHYEGYFIFDADNLIDENYVAEMNKVFDSGYRIITSYRNSKNFGTNWISAGYSLWFLREAKFLNNPRMMLNSSCAVSGTGFLVASSIIEKQQGWKYHLLTEDIEFSIASVIQGEKIGYCGTARIYDEQPTTFKQSWNQRMRWSKGFYQVVAKYGGKLITSMFRPQCHFLSCYDMFMTIAPAMFITLLSIVVNGSLLALCVIDPSYMMRRVMHTASYSVFFSFANFYLVLFMFGLLTTITEWKQINATVAQKIKSVFTFPLFMFTYVPIALAALFQKVEWKPITHSVVKSLDEVR